MNQAGFTPIVAQPRRWDVLSSFMLSQGYKNFVEIGAKEGRTTGHILKTVPESNVLAVDPWIANPAPSNGDQTRETYEKWDFEKIESEFWDNVCSCNWNKLAHQTDCVSHRCQMFRGTSEQAAAMYDELSTEAAHRLPSDLIFIDALHDYESVKQDIALWWPNVRVGGMLAGHDFNHQWPGVERAVAESFDLMQIGVASDSVWFLIKQHEGQYRAPHTHTEAA